MKKNSDGWIGVVELTEDEQKFYDAAVEGIPIAYLTNRGFISKLKKHNPEVIFVAEERAWGGSGNLVVWFIDRIKNRRIETHFGYIADVALELGFDEESSSDFLEGLFRDILKDGDRYSKYRTREPEDLDEYNYRIPWSVVLKKARRKRG